MAEEPDGSLGAATTQETEWSGSAAADDSDTRVGSGPFGERFGLDEGRWWVVGVDLARLEGGDYIDVFAFDRAAADVSNFEELEAHAAANEGKLPVTRFSLPQDISVDEFVVEYFKRFKVRIISDSLASRNIGLLETNEGDLSSDSTG